MKIFHKFSAVAVSAVAVVVVFSSVGSMTAHAATSPTLVGASGYSVLGGAEVTNTGTTTANGAVGVSPGTSLTGGGTLTAGGGQHINDASAVAAQADRLSAFTALDAGTNADANCLNPLTGSAGIAPSGTDLSGLSLVPGLYCSAGSFLLTNGVAGTDLTLSGSTGVWVFKTVSTLIVSNGASVAGGDACNVWWRIGTAATLGTTTSFRGNIVTSNVAGTTALQTGATLNGRVLGGDASTVTLDSNTITGPTCSAASSSSSSNATLHVIKDVQNDDGDDQNADDFTLYVKLAGTDVAGSPALGVASPGRSYSLAAGTYVVSEDEDSAYSQSFSGACDSNGSVTLVAGDDKTCTITNDDKKDAVKSVKKVTPKLPAAGVAPQEKNISWNSVALAGVLMLVSTSLVGVTKKHTV